jgi:tetratricopeptide (TPR) repeat protein
MPQPRAALLQSLLALALLGTTPAQQDPPTEAQRPAPTPGNPTPPLPGPGPQGAAREQMWFAPTAEDWKKPVLITFQRTWEDAVALSRETKKPILVCVNMDGEIASEHYAGVRYRQPDIAKLYEPYICVMASVYRHNPRDYDEQGRRILCPRFGCVTCGEHIAIEPLLYEKFMEGRRIAPRHIMIELDGSETYDVYYAFDTASVFQQIQDGITNRTIQADPIVRGDRSIIERLASKDIRDRDAVEQAFQDGDDTLKDALLAAAKDLGSEAPVDLLRLGVFGLDVDRSDRSRQMLAQSDSPKAVDLIAEALRAPLPQDERQELIAALDRLGETSPEARTLAVVQRGLGGRSDTVDAGSWEQAMKNVAADQGAADSYALEARLAASERALAAEPANADARLDIASASLSLAAPQRSPAAVGPGSVRAQQQHRRLLLQDAERQAKLAEANGGSGWKLDATLAVTAYEAGDTEEAYRRAMAAMRHMPDDAGDWTSMMVLQIFAEHRQLGIRQAVLDKQNWPPEWLADVHTAYSLLAAHPLGSDAHVTDHYDFVRALGGRGQADQILQKGLARFPDSGWLHERLRQSALRRRGPQNLREIYDRMLVNNPSPSMHWFAGYAGLVEAEFHRRRGLSSEALASYERAIDHYEQAIAGDYSMKATSDHYVAMAHAGRARVAFESEDYDTSLTEILECIRRKPDAFATPDGLNASPGDTARLLRARLRELERTEQGQQLQDAMDTLPKELLQLPAYEREAPPEVDNSGTDVRRQQRASRNGRVR